MTDVEKILQEIRDAERELLDARENLARLLAEETKMLEATFDAGQAAVIGRAESERKSEEIRRKRKSLAEAGRNFRKAVDSEARSEIDAEAASDRVMSLRREVALLRADRDDADRRIEEAKRDFEAKTKSIEALRDKIDDARRKLAATEGTIEHLDARLRDAWAIEQMMNGAKD